MISNIIEVIDSVWTNINDLDNIAFRCLSIYVFFLIVIKVLLYLLMFGYEFLYTTGLFLKCKCKEYSEKKRGKQLKDVRYGWRKLLCMRLLSEGRMINWEIRCFMPTIRSFSNTESKIYYLNYWMPSSVIRRIMSFLNRLFYPSWYHVIVVCISFYYVFRIDEEILMSAIETIKGINIGSCILYIKDIIFIITCIVIAVGLKMKSSVYGKINREELEVIYVVQRKGIILVHKLVNALDNNIQKLIEYKQCILNCYLSNVLSSSKYFVSFDKVTIIDKPIGLPQIYQEEVENCFREFSSLQNIKELQTEIEKICQEHALYYSKSYYKENIRLLMWFRLEERKSKYLASDCLGKEEMVEWLKNKIKNNPYNVSLENREFRKYAIEKICNEELINLAKEIDWKVQEAMDIKLFLEKYQIIAERKNFISELLGRLW